MSFLNLALLSKRAHNLHDLHFFFNPTPTLAHYPAPTLIVTHTLNSSTLLSSQAPTIIPTYRITCTLPALPVMSITPSPALSILPCISVKQDAAWLIGSRSICGNDTPVSCNFCSIGHSLQLSVFNYL